jgi:hypothetical protein
MGMENIYSSDASRRLVGVGRRVLCAGILALLAWTGGCTNLLQSIATGLAPDPVEAPSYTSMAHQKCGILALTDSGTRIEWPDLELDVANALEHKLQTAIDVKTKELEGLTVVQSASVKQYMDNHPELDTVPIATIAARLPLTRLIYIDIDDFSTRPQQTIDLYRGYVEAKVSVVEIKDGKATIAFTSDPIKIIDPPGTPQEGSPDIDESKLYSMTIDDFTTKCAELFVPHPPAEGPQ